MQILGPNGQPVSSGVPYNSHFAKAADLYSGERPWEPTYLGDIDALIPSHDRQTLVAVSRKMMQNWGPMIAIGRQIPSYSIGNRFKPSNHSADKSWQVEAESVIRDQFWPVAFMGGGSGDATEGIRNLVHLYLRDGEYFVLLTKRRSGFPAAQIIPSHQIGQRKGDNTIIDSGRYKGLRMTDGIVKNKSGETVAYHWLGATPDEDKFVSARSIIHRMATDYPEARRGYPVLSHGLNDARDSLQSHEWERFNMLFRSSRTIIEHNETGAPEDDSPGSHFTSGDQSQSDCPNSQVNILHGGTTQHFRAGSNSKLEVLEHKTPGEIYESYGDRMIRNICTGTPWPFSFIWEGRTRGGGTAERRDIEQARRTIEDVQSFVSMDIRRMTGYATKVLINLGALDDNVDWWRWSFSRPPKLSIDDGRVIKGLLDLHSRGLVSDNRILEDLGEDPDEYWAKKYEAAAQKEHQFNETQERMNVELDPRIKGIYSTNEQLPVPVGEVEADGE